MNCPKCHEPTQELDVFSTPGGPIKITLHVCPCGWDDVPDQETHVKKAIADFLGNTKKKHQAPPESPTELPT